MKIEDIILTDSSRGMDKASRFLPDNYCGYAARDILKVPRGVVFLITGFWVNGNGETDGPVGAFVLYDALEKLGYSPIVITEKYNCVPFDDMHIITNFPLKASAEDYEKIIYKFSPTAVISIERCGPNTFGDYTNIHGESIKDYTANLDLLYDLCRKRNILTIGIGDGGNEIGMGNIYNELTEILKISPCRTKADHLIIATVSNWGAYAITSSLQRITHKNILPPFSELKKFYEKMLTAGFVDGITGRNEMSVDGFDIYDEKEIYELLKAETL